MARIALDVLAPDFELTDFHGDVFHLAALRGERNVLLVFNRGFM